MKKHQTSNFKKIKIRLSNLIVSFLTLNPVVLHAQDKAASNYSVNQILDMVNESSKSLQSIEASIKSLDADFKTKDLDLSPLLNAEVNAYKDFRESPSGTPPRENTSGLLGLSLIKPFSTGTTFSISADHNLLSKDNLYPEQNTAEWQVKLTQSLWRNSFGSATRLRRDSDKYDYLNKSQLLNYEKQQLLNEIESTYWDWILATKEVSIRIANVKRSESLEQWAKKRVGQFAAERTDLLQIQALLAQRKLDLITAQNNLETVKKKLQIYLPELNFTEVTANIKNLETTRTLQNSELAQKNSNTPLRLDALAAQSKLLHSIALAEQVADSTRPSLDLYASYGANGIEDKFNPSWKESINENHTQKKIGLVLSMNLDRDLVKSQRETSKLQATALQYKAESLLKESEISWQELDRNLKQLQEQVIIAQNLYKIQNEKLNLEKKRFEQGRTTTLQMTTFEVDASESELRLYQLYAKMRKAESSTRLYTTQYNENDIKR
ncbi:MAG: TolC family protein [Pseudobdellovibrio sp.]